jgi:hypothetical protein
MLDLRQEPSVVEPASAGADLTLPREGQSARWSVGYMFKADQYKSKYLGSDTSDLLNSPVWLAV